MFLAETYQHAEYIPFETYERANQTDDLAYSHDENNNRDVIQIYGSFYSYAIKNKETQFDV